MAQQRKHQDRLDNSHPDRQKQNEQFDQERADSLDHAKQSGKGKGKGKGDSPLSKPAIEELPKP